MCIKMSHDVVRTSGMRPRTQGTAQREVQQLCYPTVLLNPMHVVILRPTRPSIGVLHIATHASYKFRIPLACILVVGGARCSIPERSITCFLQRAYSRLRKTAQPCPPPRCLHRLTRPSAPQTASAYGNRACITETTCPMQLLKKTEQHVSSRTCWQAGIGDSGFRTDQRIDTRTFYI